MDTTLELKQSCANVDGMAPTFGGPCSEEQVTAVFFTPLPCDVFPVQLISEKRSRTVYPGPQRAGREGPLPLWSSLRDSPGATQNDDRRVRAHGCGFSASPKVIYPEGITNSQRGLFRGLVIRVQPRLHK